VTLESRRAGVRPATLTYLTPGLAWKTDYVALFDEGAGKIDVQGWITLTNSSGTSYTDADVLMVAGAPNSGNSYNGNYRSYRPPAAGDLVRAGTESGNRPRLGDYYLYPLPGRTTIANAQTKQVSFLDVQGAAASKAYHFTVGWMQTLEDPTSVATVLNFSNSRTGGLGTQLPAGTVRVYIRDAQGAPQFIGESGIGHTPMGSQIAIRTGEAFDVRVKTAVTKREKITKDEWERTARYRITDSREGTRVVEVETNPVFNRTTMTYTLSNARPTPAVVNLVQSGLDSPWHDTRIVEETVRGEQVSINDRLYRVTVPANGETVVTATFDTRY
jgi:hypothetical protein